MDEWGEHTKKREEKKDGNETCPYISPENVDVTNEQNQENVNSAGPTFYFRITPNIP